MKIIVSGKQEEIDFILELLTDNFKVVDVMDKIEKDDTLTTCFYCNECDRK